MYLQIYQSGVWRVVQPIPIKCDCKVSLGVMTHEATVEHLLQSTYVDDIISSADSKEEAFELYT